MTESIFFADKGLPELAPRIRLFIQVSVSTVRDIEGTANGMAAESADGFA